MKKIILLLISVFISTFLGFAQYNIPKGFNELKESPVTGKKMKKINYDLDDDGIHDVAFWLEKDDIPHVFIYLSSEKRYHIIKVFNSQGDKFMTYAMPLNAKENVFEYRYFENNTIAFERAIKLRYNKKYKKFQVIGYDSGYRLIFGHRTKSYNLLTGDYSVTDDMAMPTNEILIDRGNKKIGHLFVNDLNIQTLQLLDSVGKEFEHY